ncbi:MAG: RHS repeat-associated core domain-containing protein, partial [Polyangiaceae bacterium]
EQVTVGQTVTQVSYGYDAVGNRTSQSDGASSVLSTFDADDRLIAMGGTTFEYDESGNLTKIVAPSGITALDHDALNRLVLVAPPGGPATTYTYDADGHRIARAEGGVETRFTIDPSQLYPQIIEERDGSGALVAHSTYGLSRISRDDGAETLYCHADGAESIAGLTDEAGVPVGGVVRDAFGNPIASTGSSVPFGYKGEATDDTGLVDMRGRVYDPSTGRFLSRDRSPISPDDFINRHRYAFVDGDPVNHADPSGWFTGSLSEVSVADSMATSLAASQQVYAIPTTLRNLLIAAEVFAIATTMTGDEADQLMCDVLPGSMDDFESLANRQPEVDEFQRNHEIFAKRKGVSPLPFSENFPYDYVVLRYVKTRTILGMSSYLDTTSEMAPMMGVSPSYCLGQPGGYVQYFGAADDGIGRALLTCVEAYSASKGHNHFKLTGIEQAYGFWHKMAMERGGRILGESYVGPLPTGKFFFWAPPKPGTTNAANLYTPPVCE